VKVVYKNFISVLDSTELREKAYSAILQLMSRNSGLEVGNSCQTTDLAVLTIDYIEVEEPFLSYINLTYPGWWKVYSRSNRKQILSKNKKEDRADEENAQIHPCEHAEDGSNSKAPGVIAGNRDYSGATKKTNPREICLFRKLDYRIMPTI
jgi:hypothetical protein